MSTSVFPGIHCGKAKAVFSQSRASRRRAFSPPAGRTLRLERHLRIGLRKTHLQPRWSGRLLAILGTAPCQGFDFPTIAHRHRVLGSSSCFVKEDWDNCRAGGTRAYKKVVECRIFVTEGSAARCSKDIARLLCLLSGRGSSTLLARGASGQLASCLLAALAARRRRSHALESSQ